MHPLHQKLAPALLASLVAVALNACGGGGGGGSDAAPGTPGGSTTTSSSAASQSSQSSSAQSSAATSSSSAASSTSSAASSTGGAPAVTSGGFSTTKGGDVAGTRYFNAATYQEIQQILDKALYNDANKKVSGGAYPVYITYTGNEDALIAEIVRDHTKDSSGNCPKPHWNDEYRHFEIKEFTKGVTIEGAPGSSANFGIIVNKSSDVVIRNMKIGALGGANNDADMIRIDSSQNVWVDHNELFAVNNECNGSPDSDLTFEAALDIKKSAYDITVSYNYFHDSKKVGLDGHTQSNGTTDFQRNITYHHNVYENVNGRLPLQRGGWIHAYNNLYTKVTESGINVRAGGIALIENNWFENAMNPLTCRFDTNGCGTWEVRGNNVTSAADNVTYDIGWSDPGSGGINANDWSSTGSFPMSKLSYTYVAQPPACVKAGLRAVAGVGKAFATLACN